MKKVIIQKNAYYDSVFLMLTAKAVKQIPDVKDTIILMGTEVNLEILENVGMSMPKRKMPRPTT